MTWAEYNDKVKALAAGLAGLGLKRGDTIGVMLTNRPEFHWVDSAAMHLGATPYSVYNTYSAEQIEYLVSDAAELDHRHRAGVPRHRHEGQGRVRVGRPRDLGRRRRGHDVARRARGQGGRRLRLRGRLEGRRARRRADADLHVRHHRSAEGRADHARQRDGCAAARSTRSSSSPTARGRSRTCRWRTSPSAPARTTCRSCSASR